MRSSACKPPGLNEHQLTANRGQPVGHNTKRFREREFERVRSSVTIFRFVPRTAMETRRYLVSGRVQGVGFRLFAQREANKLGVTGFVRNLADGSVEVVASGSIEQLAQLRALLENGPTFSSVAGVAEEPVEERADHGDGFRIA